MSRIVDVASADNLLSQSAMCPTDWHFELVFKKAHINLRINVFTTNCRTSADGLRMSVPQMVKQVRVQLIVKFVRRVTTEGNIPFVFFCDRFYVWSFVWVWSGSKSPYSANVSFHSEIIFQQLFWFVQFC